MLGANWYTAWISGGTEDYVYTTSTGQRFLPETMEILYVELRQVNVDAATGRITAGVPNLPVSQLLAAYEAGRTLCLRHQGRILPLSCVDESGLSFAKTELWDPDNPAQACFLGKVTLGRSNTVTGLWVERGT